MDTDVVMANACDILVPGYRNDHVINMRLWKAKASRELELGYFNRGDYIGAVEDKVQSETISKLLYPSDEASAGRELRLKQQYFFVAATFQDIFRRFRKRSQGLDEFPEKVAVHLNDTHPAIAIPELMRLFLDVHHLAIVGSHSVNGVAALHTELLKSGLFSDFHEMYPTRINNKTNGITPRRWLLKCNPGLADLVTQTIGDGWVTDLAQLGKLIPLG